MLGLREPEPLSQDPFDIGVRGLTVKIALQSLPDIPLVSISDAEFVYGTIVEESWDLTSQSKQYKIIMFHKCRIFRCLRPLLRFVSGIEGSDVPIHEMLGLQGVDVIPDCDFNFVDSEDPSWQNSQHSDIDDDSIDLNARDMLDFVDDRVMNLDYMMKACSGRLPLPR